MLLNVGYGPVIAVCKQCNKTLVFTEKLQNFTD